MSGTSGAHAKLRSMGSQHAVKLGRRATYADLEAVPEGKVAELIDGQLYVFPRPAFPHLNAQGELVTRIRDPFQKGRGGPGGWWIVPEPEIHFPEPAGPGGEQVVDPDLAGWRRERLPKPLAKPAHFTLPPDWVCEVLSPSTEDHDRTKKMPLYGHNGVRWVWLVDPIQRTLEIYVLGPGRRWGEPAMHRDNDRVRAVPFEAIELDLNDFWAE
jgi:Uma2 family endonuclease